MPVGYAACDPCKTQGIPQVAARSADFSGTLHAPDNLTSGEADSKAENFEPDRHGRKTWQPASSIFKLRIEKTGVNELAKNTITNRRKFRLDRDKLARR
jgi:hypothetical protein